MLDDKTSTTQTIAMGPVASQLALKMLGTHGGGFFNASSAHRFENPGALSNFLQMLPIFAIPAALCLAFGRLVGDARQGWARLAAMTPLGGALPLVLIQRGEVVFGGVGSGLYGMRVFAVMAVFIAGLMIGRQPQWQRVCRVVSQHAALQAAAGAGDVAGPIWRDRAGAGDCRIAGRQKVPGGYAGHLAHPWPALCGWTGPTCAKKSRPMRHGRTTG